MLRTGLFIALVTFLTMSLALAQESRSEFSLQGTGFFTKATSGTTTSYSATQTGGFLATYRYHLHRGLSTEVVYGFDRNTQKFYYSFDYSNAAIRIQSNNHQATAGLVQALPSFGKARFSPYVLVGGGALVFSPAGTQSNTLSGAQTQAKASFVYGGGLNYALAKRVSLRFEYRGLLFSAPDFGFGGLKTNSVTHSAEPSVGLSFRF
jgi:opacity protein-like surface antigen